MQQANDAQGRPKSCAIIDQTADAAGMTLNGGMIEANADNHMIELATDEHFAQSAESIGDADCELAKPQTLPAEPVGDARSANDHDEMVRSLLHRKINRATGAPGSSPVTLGFHAGNAVLAALLGSIS